MNKLEEARKVINEVDQKMIELYKERMNAVKEVLAYKKENQLPISDLERERQLLDKNIECLNDQELEKYYEIFFKGLLESSKKYQVDHYE